MNRHPVVGTTPEVHVEDVEEDEGLEGSPQVRGTHQPRDRAMTPAARAVHDAALREFFPGGMQFELRRVHETHLEALHPFSLAPGIAPHRCWKWDDPVPYASRRASASQAPKPSIVSPDTRVSIRARASRSMACGPSAMGRLATHGKQVGQLRVAISAQHLRDDDLVTGKPPSLLGLRFKMARMLDQALQRFQ